MRIKNTHTIVILLLLVFGMGVPHSVSALVFARDLSHGNTGSDVRVLQQFLNQDEQTRLAETGPGSPGKETDYFGTLTANAVSRYQELHRDSVLTPLGLSNGTGYFGKSTRAEMSETNPVNPTTEKKTTRIPLSNIPQTQQSETNNSDGSKKGVEIFSVSPTQGQDGTVVTLKGRGFLPTGNTVHAGYTILKDVPSNNGMIIFTVQHPFPEGFFFPPEVVDQVPSFQYGFIVQNTNGVSNGVNFTLSNTKIIEYSQAHINQTNNE